MELFPGPTSSRRAEGNLRGVVRADSPDRRGQRPDMPGNSMRENRETQSCPWCEKPRAGGERDEG